MSRREQYEAGNYIKVEFEGEGGTPGKWMWVRVHHCDDDKQLVFGERRQRATE